MNPMANKIELIVTPSHFEDIEKMSQKGATAFLFQESYFSMRGTAFFAEETFLSLIQECRRLNCQCLINVNRMFFEEDLPLLTDYLKRLKSYGVDGIYYADMAVIQIARTLKMMHLCIYNPETTISNYRDVNFYLNQGIQAITLASECTLEEMKIMGEHAEGCVEVIVHGYLNMSYSKRLLLDDYCTSSHQEMIHLNEERNCFLQEQTRDEWMPIFQEKWGTSIFTGYVMESFEEIVPLIECGIRRFRIEGIFMDQAEILDVIEGYHQIISGGNASEIKRIIYGKYSSHKMSTGYMYQKTNLVK